MNKDIIFQLTELANHYKKENEPFRAMAYAKAVGEIKKLQFEIVSVEQLKGIKGIGKGISQKINELLQEGHIQKLLSIQKTKKAQASIILKRETAIDDFLTIYGIGPVAAAKLYDEYNIKNLNQLVKESEKNPKLLTAAQKIGLKYREDLLKRINHDFINQFQFTITYVLNSEFGETFKLQTAGSFRRKKPTSGDIDIMLQTTQFTLKQAVEVLISYGLIIGVLAIDSKKFMGVATCPGIENCVPFRLDIFMVDASNWWTALVTHTGPKELNTMMRSKAASLGMKLSDQGLWRGNKKINIYSEKDLFKKLNMDYIEPTKR